MKKRNRPVPATPAVVLGLAEAAREKLRVDPRESLRMAETALAHARKLGDPKSHGLALRAKANALWFLNQNQPAVELYEHAISIFQDLGENTEVARTLSSAIQPLIRLGQYARALEGAQRARKIFQDTGDALRLARLELNAANILHRQDRFTEAIEAYEQAYRQLLPFKDTEGIAVALHNMAVCLIALNDFQKALAAYSTARSFYQAHGMPALVAQADYNIAYLYYLRGDYSRALGMLRTARQAAEQSGDQYHRALCWMDESEVYLELNMHEEAAGTAQEAFTGFQALGMPYEAGKSLANLAIAQGRMGRPARSLELFGAARAIFVREENAVWPALLDLYQALVLYEDGRLAEACRLCADALQLFAARRMGSKEALCRMLMGRLGLRAADPAGARLHCQAALRLLENLEAPHLSWQARFLMGQIEEAEGQFAQAERSYQLARAGAESLRSILRGEELKIAFMKGKQEIYEGLVRLCLHLSTGGQRREEAFGYMEQAKSRSLRDLLVEPVAAWAGQEAFPAARQARELREELNWYYHRIELAEAGQEEPAGARLEPLRQEARSREKALMALVRAMPAPEAEIAGIAAHPAATLAAIRKALGPRTTLVEYFRVGGEIIAAVLKPGSLEIAPLAPAARIAELARLLDFQFSKFRLGPEYVTACAELLLEAARSHLHGLYDALIAPIAKHLSGDRLVFVPHESLHHLPLHALFDGQRYLIDRFAISYAPSASIYALCSARGANARGPSLILGVPDPRAPLIGNEVRAVAAMLPDAEIYMAEQANRWILEERAPHSRILHIATHGHFREDSPMFSAIRLGDGDLTLYDLYRLRLPVELATLSGCSTGLSVVASGDELLGLMRGLLYAGAQSLLLTLWDVQDRTTAELMKAFYRRFPAQPDKAAAVQAAMREIRSRYPHPYYWAALVLIGKP